MKKKALAILVCFIFLFTGLFAADKKAKTEQKEVKKTVESRVKKEPPEPKNAEFKEKIGIGIDVLNKMGSIRFWVANKLGLDFIAGMGFVGGNPSAFTLKLGSNIVFPLIDDQKLRLDMAPGLLLSYSKNTLEEFANLNVGSLVEGDISTLKFLFNVGLSLEVFLTPISGDLSLGSQIGLGFGLKSTSVGSSSTTNFIFSLAEDIAVFPVIIRYYL